MSERKSFCTTLPTQLKAWDATSLRAYMECPRKYQYRIVETWGNENVHIEFGKMYGDSQSAYDMAIAGGATKAQATDAAVEFALGVSWIVKGYVTEGVPIMGPWGGDWKEAWRCSSPARVINTKGKEVRNVKRCPNAKAYHFSSGPDGDCSMCGLPIERSVEWVSQDTKKDRMTLIRAIVEYCDAQPEHGGIRPYVFPDGKVAVELSWNFPLPLESPDKDPYLLCGHLDGLVTFSGEFGVRERKTTKSTLNKQYFDRYAPDVQIDTYDLAAYMLYRELKPSGVMVEATQTAVEFTAFQRQFIGITGERRQETFDDIQYWIKRAEADARVGYYPKNTSACSANGGCQFRRICSLSPSSRERFLPEYFKKRVWDPIVER